VVTCSCGWQPKTAPDRMSTMDDPYIAHRREQGMPYAGHIDPVFGEGPWTGLTWDEWYSQHGGTGIDPYTGEVREY
jgi:hypothetical protein